jgi:hypothetical protein
MSAARPSPALAPPAAPVLPLQMPEAEQKKLLALLDELAQAAETLLMTGLTTASDATRAKLDVGLKEASRMRLLRLGSTLRLVSEEIGRYAANNSAFSRRRFSFFLNRAWLLCKGLAHAMRSKDAPLLDRLLWVPSGVPVKSIEAATIGVSKRVVQNAFFAFDVRLRLTKPVEIPGPDGKPVSIKRLSWSFGHRFEPELPPEGVLHLAQGNSFKPIFVLENPSFVLENVAITPDASGGGRLSINPKSEVKKGTAIKDLNALLEWDAAAALARIREHRAGPLDLDIELQEEVVLRDWTLRDARPGTRDDQTIIPILCRDIEFSAVVSKLDGATLLESLNALKKKKALPPLFGLLHYENCQLMLQPLSIRGKDGMVQLMLSKEKIDPKALLKTMNFQR